MCAIRGTWEVPTLFWGIPKGEGPNLFIIGRLEPSADGEHIVRFCGLLEKSSANRCCRYANPGHMIRPADALLRRLVVPIFIFECYYASARSSTVICWKIRMLQSTGNGGCGC